MIESVSSGRQAAGIKGRWFLQLYSSSPVGARSRPHSMFLGVGPWLEAKRANYCRPARTNGRPCLGLYVLSSGDGIGTVRCDNIIWKITNAPGKRPGALKKSIFLDFGVIKSISRNLESSNPFFWTFLRFSKLWCDDPVRAGYVYIIRPASSACRLL